jgi:hypothetical protein
MVGPSRRQPSPPRSDPACSLSRQRVIPRLSRKRPPRAPADARGSPQDGAWKAPLTAGISACLRSAPNRQDPPVTPEVAGSSPVAPAQNILQIGIFCCQDGRERPPVFRVSRSDPARLGKGLVCSDFRPIDPAMRRFHPARDRLGHDDRARCGVGARRRSPSRSERRQLPIADMRRPVLRIRRPKDTTTSGTSTPSMPTGAASFR